MSSSLGSAGRQLPPFEAKGWGGTVSLWGPVVLLMAAIFVASSMPSLGVPVQVSDKLAHVLVYGLLAALLVRALAGGRQRGVTWRISAGAAALAVLYGMTDELHQAFVPGRVADLADLVADTTGATVSAGAVWAWSIIGAARGGLKPSE